MIMNDLPESHDPYHLQNSHDWATYRVMNQNTLPVSHLINNPAGESWSKSPTKESWTDTQNEILESHELEYSAGMIQITYQRLTNRYTEWDTWESWTRIHCRWVSLSRRTCQRVMTQITYQRVMNSYTEWATWESWTRILGRWVTRSWMIRMTSQAVLNKMS